jgi:hypothetical protein
VRAAAALLLVLGVAAFAAAGRTQGVDKYVEPPKPKVQPPRAAPAAPAAPTRPAAPAQPAGPPLVAEIMRKGQAGDDENGFCARANWQVLTWEHETFFYDGAIPGSVLLTINPAVSPPVCWFSRVTSVSDEGGGRCVHALVWWCSVGGKCSHSPYKYCKDSGGTYRPR